MPRQPSNSNCSLSYSAGRMPKAYIEKPCAYRAYQHTPKLQLKIHPMPPTRDHNAPSWRYIREE